MLQTLVRGLHLNAATETKTDFNPHQIELKSGLIAIQFASAEMRRLK